jgi:hypothetical protein
LEDLARKYWKKRSYIFQGFVQDSPLSEDEPADNPIRRFIISPQLFNIIKSALMDPDLEEMPTSSLNGLDFRITKTQKGQYADYTTSKYARKETALSQEQLDAIEEYGLVDLNSYLPKKPDAEAVEIIHEMFQASINGELYDPVRFGKFYKPYGLQLAESKNESVPAEETKTEAKSEPVTEIKAEPEAPKVEETDSGNEAPKKSVNDILAMVQKRKSS